MEISIQANQLTKEYPARRALTNITFKVKKGSIHGFLGPNGAGKTTTMKILTGLVGQTSGEFKIEGQIGFLPENPPLYLNMTVNDYLKYVMNIYTESFNQARLDEVKKECGLIEVGERLIGNLSKGFKQRVGIAQALIHNPEIIILDEPTVGLDPVAIVEIRNLIASLKNKHTVLFSSHQLHEVELLCDEITLVNNGQVIVSGSINEIQNKLTTKRHYRAEVLNFKNENENELKKQFAIDSIEFQKKDDLFILNIFAQVAFDPKQDLKKLTQYLGQDSIGLISFQEEKLDLEEIFKRMTIG